jgi:two-component system, sensor histidine kinase
MQQTGGYSGSSLSHVSPSPACRVLVIDDSPDMIRLLGAYLTDAKIHVTSAPNGLVGLIAFKYQKFDLVIMDIDMPKMDGYSATIAMRAWERDQHLPRTPIAALTAVSDYDAPNRIFLAGCNMHLSKPVGRDELLGAMRQLKPRR